MYDLDENLAKELEKLKIAYIDDLSTKLEFIESSMDGCINNSFGNETMHTLHISSHTMAGTAAMHKLTEISKSARAIELHVQDLIEEKAGARLEAGVDETVKISALVATLRSAVESIVANNSVERLK